MPGLEPGGVTPGAVCERGDYLDEVERAACAGRSRLGRGLPGPAAQEGEQRFGLIGADEDRPGAP